MELCWVVFRSLIALGCSKGLPFGHSQRFMVIFWDLGVPDDIGCRAASHEVFLLVLNVCLSWVGKLALLSLELLVCFR